MTYSQFYKLLAQTKKTFSIDKTWKSIRSTSGRNKNRYCPITGCAKRYKYNCWQWYEAAKEIGLSYEQARKITDAADNNFGHSRKIRSSLLKTLRSCGKLKE